jgi:hypothetical protein
MHRSSIIAPTKSSTLSDAPYYNGTAFPAGMPQLVHVNSRTGISTPKARAAIAAALEKMGD